MNNIITIGREFGSGGRELGRRLSEKLGFAYYDKEIIPEIAKRTETAEKYVRSIVDREPSFLYPIHIAGTFMPYFDGQVEMNQEIYKQQENIIREYAEKSDCVIVGRCADFILKDKNPMRIFVYADMPSRIERCRQKSTENEDLSEKVLKKKINEIDRNRASYYSFYTGQEWGNRLNYDLCINTSGASIKSICEAVTFSGKKISLE